MARPLRVCVAAPRDGRQAKPRVDSIVLSVFNPLGVEIPERGQTHLIVQEAHYSVHRRAILLDLTALDRSLRDRKLQHGQGLILDAP